MPWAPSDGCPKESFCSEEKLKLKFSSWGFWSCPHDAQVWLKHSSGFGNMVTVTTVIFPQWLSKGISWFPQFLRMVLIQKEAALTSIILILFPLYFYDCHVDRGKWEERGRQMREKEKQDVKFCLWGERWQSWDGQLPLALLAHAENLQWEGPSISLKYSFTLLLASKKL